MLYADVNTVSCSTYDIKLYHCCHNFFIQLMFVTVKLDSLWEFCLVSVRMNCGILIAYKRHIIAERDSMITWRICQSQSITVRSLADLRDYDFSVGSGCVLYDILNIYR